MSKRITFMYVFGFQANFFSAIERNGYKLLYLSARAIGQVRLTKLKSVMVREKSISTGLTNCFYRG